MLNDLIHLFYPNNCACCNHVLKKGEPQICIICQSELPKTNYIKHFDNPVAKLFWGRVQLTYGFSTFSFGKKGKLQELIHELKYKDNTDIGLFLGKEIGKEINESIPPNTFSYVVPVPLHPKKQLKRGYNQSTFLAQGISQVTNIPINERIIQRKVETESQTKKNKFERWENVDGIFKVNNPKSIEGKHILLVDDVITTGSTIESCALEILKTHNVKVSVAIAASGI